MLDADQNVQFSKKHNALLKDFFGKKFKFRTRLRWWSWVACFLFWFSWEHTLLIKINLRWNEKCKQNINQLWVNQNQNRIRNRSPQDARISFQARTGPNGLAYQPFSLTFLIRWLFWLAVLPHDLLIPFVFFFGFSFLILHFLFGFWLSCRPFCRNRFLARFFGSLSFAVESSSLPSHFPNSPLPYG